MMWVLTLLAEVRPTKRDPFREPEVIWGTIGLMLALLVGAFFVWIVDRWRKKTETGPAADEALSEFRAMLERGEITQEEYVRLRERVSERVKPAAPSPAADANPAGSSL
jgi:hypothetical protein